MFSPASRRFATHVLPQCLTSCNYRLPEAPFIVKARFVSKLAEEKIKAAGGVVELVG